MDERHENEQYFFDEPTLAHLADFVTAWERLCCLCAPLLGRRLAKTGISVITLDIDERFGDCEGFRRYDLDNPRWLGQRFDLIVCDPPFFGVSLGQLGNTLRVLSRFEYTQPILLSYLKRRSEAVIKTFAPFNLQPTGYHPTYQAVPLLQRNEIEMFGNLTAEQTQKLRRA